MGYQVLARKYRPQRFADVAGQDHVTRTLMNALSQGRIAHGYIFSGHRGIGKTTIARILAQALNCRTAVGSAQRPTPEPCGVCDSCVEVKQGTAVDVIEIDAATNRGIDEIRELRDAARYAPARDRYKIYILDEAHQITEAAFNALLKTLEEPPAHVVFMMATTEPENIPQTIRSRCQHFSFHAVRFDDILAQLQMIAGQENVRTEEAALALLAEAGDGSMRDALSIMDQAIASAPCEDGVPHLAASQIRDLMGSVPNAVFERLMEAVAEGTSAPLMEQLNVLLNAGHSPLSLARQLVRYLRNALMAKLGGEATELLQISSDERARAARTALLFSEEDLTRDLQIVLRTFDDLNYRQEQRFHLELGLLKLVHAQRLLPLEELLSGLPLGAGKSGGSGSPAARPTPMPSRPGPPPHSSAPELQAPFGSAPFGSGHPQPAYMPRETSPLRIAPEPVGSASAETVPQPVAVAEPTPRPAEQPARPALASAPAPAAKIAVMPQTSAVPQASAGPRAAVTPQAPVLSHAAETSQKTVPAFVPPVSEPVPPASHAIDAVTMPEPLAPVIMAEAEPGASEPAPVTVPAFVGRGVPEPTAEVVSLAPEEPEVEAEALAGVSAAGSTPEVEALRQAVVSALANGGHTSASQLVATANWNLDGSNLRIEVPGIGKKMLSLTVNAVADKIMRQEIQRLGGPARLLVVPGEGSAPRSAGAAIPLAGSIQETALANPLVQRAKEIFKAEVRSVVDLRTP